MYKRQVVGLFNEMAKSFANEYSAEIKKFVDWSFEEINENCMQMFRCPFELKREEMTKADAETLGKLIYENAVKYYDMKESHYGSELMRELEKMVMLSTVDNSWKDHLFQIDHLKEGISLRGYAQKLSLIHI